MSQAYCQRSRGRVPSQSAPVVGIAAGAYWDLASARRPTCNPYQISAEWVRQTGLGGTGRRRDSYGYKQSTRCRLGVQDNPGSRGDRPVNSFGLALGRKYRRTHMDSACYGQPSAVISAFLQQRDDKR